MSIWWVFHEYWAVFDRYLICIWLVFDIWCVFDQYLMSIWLVFWWVFDQYLINIWSLFDRYLILILWEFDYYLMFFVFYQYLMGIHQYLIGIWHAPGGAKSKSYRRTPKERKMALKHRTPPALNEHRYLNQFCASRIQFWVPGRPLGFDFRTWGYNLGPPGIDIVSILGLYSSRIGPWE